MNQLAGNFDKVFKSIDFKVPTQVTEMVEANIDQAIAIYEKTAENMKSYGQTANALFGKQHALARELAERFVENTHINVSAAFDVAKKLAGSRSVQEAIKIQTDFAQDQTKRLVGQVNETMHLALKVGSGAVASWQPDFPTKVPRV